MTIPGDYQLRLEGPELLERGVPRVLACPAYRSGQLVIPTAATISLRRPAGTLLLDAVSVGNSAAIATAGGARYSVTVPSDEELGEGWTVEWALTLGGIAVSARAAASVVRRALVCPITGLDLYERYSGLDPKAPAGTRITGASDHQGKITTAFRDVILRVRDMGVRPEFVASLPDLREATLERTLELIFNDLASRTDGGQFVALATQHREAYQAALRYIRLALDTGQDGTADEGGRRRPTTRMVMLGAPPGPDASYGRGGYPWRR